MKKVKRKAIVRRAIVRRAIVRQKTTVKRKAIKSMKSVNNIAEKMIICFGRTNLPINKNNSDDIIARRIQYLKEFTQILDMRRQWVSTKEEEEAIYQSRYDKNRFTCFDGRGTFRKGNKPNRPKITKHENWMYIINLKEGK